MKRLSIMIAGVLALPWANFANASVYQTDVNLACASGICFGSSAVVPAGKTLTVQTLSCLVANSAATTVTGFGELYRSSSGSSFAQVFAVSPAVSASITPVMNAPMTVNAGDKAVLYLQPGASSPTSGHCALRGTLTP